MGQTAIQAILYIVAFLMANIWTGVIKVIGSNKGSVAYFTFSLLSQVFFPLQGFMNFFIFIRPRYMDLRRKNPDTSSWKLLAGIFDEKRADVESPKAITSVCQAIMTSEADLATAETGEEGTQTTQCNTLTAKANSQCGAVESEASSSTRSGTTHSQCTEADVRANVDEAGPLAESSPLSLASSQDESRACFTLDK